MRQLAVLLLLLGLVGCHDYDHFRLRPPGAGLDLGGAAGDLAGVDLGGVDLAGVDPGGCPPLHDDVPTGCVVERFEAPLAGWSPVPGTADGVVTSVECGMLRVQVPGGAGRDFWSEDLGAYRLERSLTVSGPVQVVARISARLELVESFVGLYLRTGTRYVNVEALFEPDTRSLVHEATIFTAGTFDYEQGETLPLAPLERDFRFMIDRPVSGSPSWIHRTNNAISTWFAPAPDPQTVGIVIGNARDLNTLAPPVDAYIEWVAICPHPLQ